MSTSSFQNTYCSAVPGSFRENAILRARRKIYAAIQKRIPLEKMESILDVGVTADEDCAFSNYFEFTYPHPDRITAVSNQDAAWMERKWPGMKFVQADGRALPFKEGQFDLVYSSAVLEHVGSREQQCRFLSECVRVARKHVFITTPNRWFPLEMHSGLPFVHWLPMPMARKCLRAFGFPSLADEANLNLFSARDLRKLCSFVDPNGVHLEMLYFCGFPSNLLLHIEKKDEP